MNKEEKIRHFNTMAQDRHKWRKKGAYYHSKLGRYLHFRVDDFEDLQITEKFDFVVIAETIVAPLAATGGYLKAVLS